MNWIIQFSFMGKSQLILTLHINNSQSNKIGQIKMQNCDAYKFDDLSQKNRLSRSTSNSEQSVGQKNSESQLSPCVSLFKNTLTSRTQLLTNKVEQPEITEKTTSKALKWLITICWTNDLCDQTLYISTILFYIYKANRKIPKTKLQLILLTSIYLSSKKCQTKKLKAKDILALSIKKFTTEELVQTQYQMLELLNYNLEFEHNLIGFFWRTDIEKKKMDQIQFLTQLALFQSADILFQTDIFQELIQTVLNHGRPSIYQQTILRLSKLSQAKVLINKYASKFDAEELLISLFDLYQ